MMKLSDTGLRAIACEEGFVGHVYLCPAGVWTIGYGHALLPGETYPHGISEPEALELLRRDAQAAADTVNVRVCVPLTQGQFDALVSFTFNVGGYAFGKSTLLRLLNQGDYAGACAELPKWRKGGGKVLPVLVARRAREVALFMRRDDAADTPAEPAV